MLNQWYSTKKLNKFRLAVILLAGIFCFFNIDICIFAYSETPWARAIQIAEYTQYYKTYTYPTYKFSSEDGQIVMWDSQSTTAKPNITPYNVVYDGHEYLEIELPEIANFYITNDQYDKNKYYDIFHAYIHAIGNASLTFTPRSDSYGSIYTRFISADVIVMVDGVEYNLSSESWAYIPLESFLYNQFNFRLKVRFLLDAGISNSSKGTYVDGEFTLNASLNLTAMRLYGDYETSLWQYRLADNMITGFNNVNNNLSILHNDNEKILTDFTSFKISLFANMKTYFDRQHTDLSTLHTDLSTLHTDNTTFLARFNSFWTDIVSKFTGWFDRQHDDLVKLLEETTEGYDNSAGNSQNDKLSGALGNASDAEDQITGSASGYIKDFNPSSSLNFASGTVSGLSLVKSFANGFLDSSGEFKNVISVIYAMAFVSIVVGLWRFVRK